MKNKSVRIFKTSKLVIVIFVLTTICILFSNDILGTDEIFCFFVVLILTVYYCSFARKVVVTADESILVYDHCIFNKKHCFVFSELSQIKINLGEFRMGPKTIEIKDKYNVVCKYHINFIDYSGLKDCLLERCSINVKLYLNNKLLN